MTEENKNKKNESEDKKNKKKGGGSVVMIGAAVLIAVCGVAVHQLGLFDRPDFVYEETLLAPYQKDTDGILYAVLAMSTERNIGKHVMRLLEGTARGITYATLEDEAVSDFLSTAKSKGKHDIAMCDLPKTPVLQTAGKAWYGSSEDDKTSPLFHEVGVGLYLDDPNIKENPRWGIGWAVVLPDELDEEQFRNDMLPKIQKESNMTDPIKLVPMKPAVLKTLRAEIPWRTPLTPMIAPMIHWTRGFTLYEKEYNSSDTAQAHTSRDDDATGGPLAIEVYLVESVPVKAKKPDEEKKYKDKNHHIDYIVVFGDTDHVWDAATSTSTTTTEGTASTEEEGLKKEQEVVVEEAKDEAEIQEMKDDEEEVETEEEEQEAETQEESETTPTEEEEEGDEESKEEEEDEEKDEAKTAEEEEEGKEAEEAELKNDDTEKVATE